MILSSHKNNIFLMILSVMFSFFILPTYIFADSSIITLDKDLEIRELTKEIYIVIHKFPWPGNSLLVLIGTDDVVFVDTPYTPEATDQVLDWIENTFGNKNIVEINTGYHVDNLGGNEVLIHRKIPVYGSTKTARLLAERGEQTRNLILSWLTGPGNKDYSDKHKVIPYIPPDHLFDLKEGLSLTIGNEKVEVIYPGETHAPDNVAVYFPQKKLLFGGCMIRCDNTLGNIEDANLETWKTAIMSLRNLSYNIVIPGHGYRFDADVINNTISLFP
ncbi:MAG: MBL fold metallo-hydrolase [Spirochaetales bacterium]|nr:MBL fold metallo-hydrolase [Spirochaetales bacterium]